VVRCNFNNSCTHANASSLEHGLSFNSFSMAFTELEFSAIPKMLMQIRNATILQEYKPDMKANQVS